MGKPFKTELGQIESTYKWANDLNIDSLKQEINQINNPIYFVGSGGSLSACYLGVSLVNELGVFAKAVTPLELYNEKNNIRHSTVIIISASGKNSDIIFGFNTAVKFHAKKIISICLQLNSKIAELSNKLTISEIFEYNLPVGKDGFLATNSLLTFFVILNRIFAKKKLNYLFNKDSYIQDLESFVNALSPDSSITVLYNDFSKCVANDIESKSIEAALYPILLSDFRNFGHGRHHWFAKKNKTAAMLVLSGLNDRFLAVKTLEAMPENIPKLHLQTSLEGGEGALDLLIKSYFLIDKFGESLNIDPGRPGVPAFGRKLYNLKYSRQLFENDNNSSLTIRASTAISRKVDKPIGSLDKKNIAFWFKAYTEFVSKLSHANFGAIVFDYDGTLCSSERKYLGPDSRIAAKLNLILDEGFYIGVVTGRGQSVRTDLQNIIPRHLWSKVFIGYYNGSELGGLGDNLLPNKGLTQDENLKAAQEILKSNKIGLKIKTELRPNQLTISIDECQNMHYVQKAIIELIQLSNISNLRILKSSHSIDIIPSGVSKKNIFNYMKETLEIKQLSKDLLCIGDKGKWPGNDFMLLDSSYSLSVDEVNYQVDTCWNLAPNGMALEDATLYYLGLLKFGKTGMKLSITK